jgi:hypothetical protein
MKIIFSGSYLIGVYSETDKILFFLPFQMSDVIQIFLNVYDQKEPTKSFQKIFF